MITIMFPSRDTVGAMRTFGPAPYFRLDGRKLRAGPDNTLVATYLNHQWQHDDDWFTVLSIPAPVKLRFEGGAASTFGVFRHLQFRDGYLFAGNLNLASYEEQNGRWFVPHENRHFASVVMEEP